MSTFFLTRSVLFRWAGLVFLTAFASSYFQNDALIGATNGLLPAPVHLERIALSNPHPLTRFRQADVAKSDWEASAWCEASSGWFAKPLSMKQQQQQREIGAVANALNSFVAVIETGRLPASLDAATGGLFSRLIDAVACYCSRKLLSRSRSDHAAAAGLPSWSAFRTAPTLLWFVPTSDPVFFDQVLCGIIPGVGMALSVFMIVTGTSSSWIMLSIYALYFSIVSVGTQWFSFGWEFQVLEVALALAFAAPWLNPFEGSASRELGYIPRKVLLWHLARILWGAGLIKMRGDTCWRDLTCMKYHYETQPNPGPTSIFFHASPLGFHRFEVLVNHFVELAVPALLLLPSRFAQPVVAFGGVAAAGFMLTICVSGNLAFLNHLTILPAIAALHDGFLVGFLRFFRLPGVADNLEQYVKQQQQLQNARRRPFQFAAQLLFHGAFALVVLSLSIPAVDNLLLIRQPRQAMNMPHHWTNVLGSYGAFGSITRDRPEVRFEIESTPNEFTAIEVLYKFSGAAKIDKRPVWITPYHSRFAWLCWFSGFMGVNQQTPHFLHFLYMLARNSRQDRLTLSTVLEPESIALLEQLASSSSSSSSSSSKRRVRVMRQKYRFNVISSRRGWEWDLIPLLDVTKRFGPSVLRPLVHALAVQLYGEAVVESRAVKNPTHYWAEGLSAEELVPPVRMADLENLVSQITGKQDGSSGSRRR